MSKPPLQDFFDGVGSDPARGMSGRAERERFRQGQERGGGGGGREGEIGGERGREGERGGERGDRICRMNYKAVGEVRKDEGRDFRIRVVISVIEIRRRGYKISQKWMVEVQA